MLVRQFRPPGGVLIVLPERDQCHPDVYKCKEKKKKLTKFKAILEFGVFAWKTEPVPKRRHSIKPFKD